MTTEQRRKCKSVIFTIIPQREEKWKDQGTGVHKWSATESIHSEEDVASPIVSTESVFITLAIAASEKRHVSCYDVPSAFVNTDVDENVLIVLKSELAEMMVHIAPKIYCKYITVDRKSTSVLYIKLQKALDGLMRVSLLFYRKLHKELEECRFVVNP